MKTYPTIVESFIKLIVRNTLSLENNVFPREITDAQLKDALNKGETQNYTIKCDICTSYENGKKCLSYIVALVSKATGEWFDSRVFDVKEETK